MLYEERVVQSSISLENSFLRVQPCEGRPVANYIAGDPPITFPTRERFI